MRLFVQLYLLYNPSGTYEISDLDFPLIRDQMQADCTRIQLLKANAVQRKMERIQSRANSRQLYFF